MTDQTETPVEPSDKQLAQYVERLERLAEEKQGIATDIKDVFAEAKMQGYDTKTLRKVLAIRKMNRQQRLEEEALLETYKNALGL